MKHFILIAVIYLFAQVTASAQNCRYVRTQTDPFTKQSARTALLIVGPGLAGWEVILEESEGKYYLGMRMVHNGTKSTPYTKGSPIMFKLSNDDMIELKASEDYKAIPITFLDAPFTQWIVKEQVSIETFKKLTASHITAIKTFVEGNESLLPKIIERQTQKIIESAKCLLAKQS